MIHLPKPHNLPKPHIRWWQHLYGTAAITGIMALLLFAFVIIVLLVDAIGVGVAAGITWLAAHVPFFVAVCMVLLAIAALTILAILGRYFAEDKFFPED